MEKPFIILSKPIKAHGEDEVTKLEFKEPSGTEVIELGLPFSFGQDKRTYVDGAALGEYISRLAGIPMSSVKQLAPADFIAAFGVVAGFFGASAPTQPKS